ncbi:hypothetical protein Clacol_007558 [Clathrus columnatus]|uniref:Protein kinase domain-containing protein n=1 Tax=Clathrus columnatus TaxID=1419009 RepID=A0AAV5AF84_9AGAM|nr:hypothetical protein Clacol_007558 [Clathrus columnatus]
MALIPPPTEATDIFSLSDHALSERYQFVEEIGFGNWGSVWLCRPKDAQGNPIIDPEADARGTGKVAVKLVHRSKTATTAARVRSLTYLPTLVPVEVPELRAKPWCLSLISAVAFLHAHGIVHNDIKPANILLTAAEPPTPVLVDFGFAEKYDPRSSKAFLSNLAYGTPEYLSPERARGLPHDTRKSDVWSLGVTLFEILRGRTPFEHAEPDGKTETFSTKAELEKYWARTVKGKWVGKWTMTKGLERLLRKMILPNADLRITARVALNDSYFDPHRLDDPHKSPSRLPLSPRNTSEAEASQLIDTIPSHCENSGASPPASLLKTVTTNKRRASNVNTGKENNKENVELSSHKPNLYGHHRTQSAKVNSPNKAQHTNTPLSRNVAKKMASSTAESSNSGLASPSQSSIRPDVRSVLSVTVANRSAKSNSDLVASPVASHRASIITSSSFTSKENNNGRSSRTGTGRRVPVRKPMPAVFSSIHKIKSINDEDTHASNSSRDNENSKKRVLVDLTKVKANEAQSVEVSALPLDRSMKISGSLIPVVEVDPPPGLESRAAHSPNKSSTGISVIRQSIRQSTSGLSVVAPELSPDNDSSFMHSNEDSRESWENQSVIRNVKSSLPTVRHAIRNEQLAADNRLDRMTIWIRNVERVVEDARANFAAGSMAPLPPLPPPTSQGSRKARVNEIFPDGISTDVKGSSQVHRPRRRTVGSPSSEPLKTKQSGSKNDETWDLSNPRSLSRPITPLINLQLDADKEPRSSARTPTRLSAIIDPNAFFIPKADEEPEPTFTPSERLRAVLTPVDPNIPPTVQRLNSPVEADYDQILMASHSVKRVGKGYESNIVTSNVVEPMSTKRNPNLFHSTRREVIAPPETPRKAASVDELGALNASQAAQINRRDEGNTFSFMRRALKVITGGTVSRRLSKVM